ncbi:ECF-family RNA polymerase sigma factor [Sorangium cellulosum So ce56]|uniref:ECF-family RNA polymerase sigma factor n=1 Tax=Sorangium cellulosum (strain So ce56) TaxID=448385 RepID=A9GP18_SORC5|nr:RNA polymerase sigma factor [Sorangium cellulosum]CAN96692.1 ECF-family RNA polymerase sigma factor [Sorangium cellulosum So ce56]
MNPWGPYDGPARVLTIAEIAAQEPHIRSALRGLGVPAVDIDDVCQDVVLGAWISAQAGRYRPDHAREPLDALKRWLFGVCRFHCTHYHERAFRRREVSVADPWAATGEERVDPGHVGERIDAGKALMAIAAMPIWAREVLVLAALGHGGTEIAKLLRIPLGTAGSRLRLARARLKRKLRRRR